jgi:hypothetical protein
LDENYCPGVRFVRTSADVVRTSARVRVYPSVRTDVLIPSLGPSSPLPSPLPPSPLSYVCCLMSARTGCVRADADADARKKEKKKFILFLVVVAGLKRERKIRFSVFNPQDPRDPWAKRAKPREEEGFFGLVPLVTHPSSIPLLGGLTPKFLSLSLHSL